MTRTLSGKSVIVTGASSGIGLATARLLSSQGARLVLADIDMKGGLALESELCRRGGETVFVQTDVADESQVSAMVRLGEERFGKIDGAFNNAGIGYPAVGLHELDLAHWQRTLNINLTGVFLCLKHEIGSMLKTGGGSIVNTGSVASLVGLPHASAYGAAKHGVLGLTRNAAVDYSSRGIRVNALLVGATITPLTTAIIPDAETNMEIAKILSQLHRFAKPEEIAQAALWLLSDASSFVAGSGLTIDGGYTAA